MTAGSPSPEPRWTSRRRADPFTERIALAPDEVAIPGMTDAHLHLAAAAEARSHVDLSGTRTLEEGLIRIGTAHRALPDRDAWLQGHGWDADRWGVWPTADDLEGVAPGRRGAFWAHDHHALLVTRAGLVSAGIDDQTEDPTGGVVGRSGDGRPDGVLFETATRLVSTLVPSMGSAELELSILAVAAELLALGIVAVHDPGSVAPDPDLERAYPVYARLSETGRLPIRVMASLREDALATALAGGLRSGDILGEDPAGRARIGWLKCFADGSLGSRTAALLADIEPEPDRPVAPERRRGLWTTDPASTSGGGGASGTRRDRHPGPRHRGCGGPCRIGRPDPDGGPRPVHAESRTRPVARSRRLRPVRLRRGRRERPAVTPGQRRGDRPATLGRASRAERLYVAVDRRHRSGHRVRYGCSGRIVRPVAGYRACGPP